MAQRETSAGRTKRDKRVTPQGIAAGRANLDKGRAAKREATKKAREAGTPRAKERWAQLLDGTLTVRDLDDAEIKAMRVKGADGGFSGRRAAIPSHLAQQFHQEAIRRATDKIRTAAPEAVDALLDIAKDTDVKDSDRIKVLLALLDRGLGKVPETVRIEGQSKFDALLDGSVDVDRDLADDI